jgi:guanyl-specific ribonuclease Sa
MNTQSHRLIFNPTRGCMMAVAETASSASNTPSATSKARSRSSKNAPNRLKVMDLPYQKRRQPN